jgi:Anti-sigma regulatory factor (Ser/Thr protein kinase)
MFGVSRLKELLMKSPGKAANQVVNEVIENVKTFSGRDQLDDDLTAVAVRVAFPGTPLKAAESLMLPSSLDQLHYMREALSRFCEKARRFGWIDGDTIELSLAVNEVMTNIIRHAHGENASEKLLIHFSLFEDRIDINVEYHGKTFTPPTDITPSLDGSKDGGFGLYIINKMVDDVLYADGESGRRRVFLTKYIKNLRSQKLL